MNSLDNLQASFSSIANTVNNLHIRDYSHADWKYEKLVEQLREYESTLDSDHELAACLASFGSMVTMVVTELGYQNPDMLYFYGYVNGKPAQLIQHVSQLNLLLTSVEREDKTKPARRIGFTASYDEDS